MTPKGANSGRFSRRALFGWLASTFGAGALLTLIASVTGVLSSRPLTIWGYSKVRERHDRAKQRRQRRKAVAKTAKVNRQLLAVVRKWPSTKLRSSVIHWPHPAFRNTLFFGKRAAVLQTATWKTVVKPRCALRQQNFHPQQLTFIPRKRRQSESTSRLLRSSSNPQNKYLACPRLSVLCSPFSVMIANAVIGGYFNFMPGWFV